jgi:hypothetical protein
VPPPVHGRESPGILKFLDLRFFTLDLLTSEGLSAKRPTPSELRLFPLQPIVSRFIARPSGVGVCSPPLSAAKNDFRQGFFTSDAFVIGFCFIFFLICIFLCWVMVSFGDPFTGSFVMLFVVPILFHIQISGHPTLSKGLFWTGLKSSALVMSLFTTDLVFNLPCAD